MFKLKTVKNSALSGAAFLTLALPVTAQWEGLRLKAYLDPVGIPTICYGETEGVEIGDIKSREECDNMLAIRLAWFGYQVDKMINVPMSEETHAALASFTYNVGVGAFSNSTLRKKMNAGDIVGACNELPRWNKAGGRVLAGLVKRREAERQLCLSGVNI